MVARLWLQGFYLDYLMSFTLLKPQMMLDSKIPDLDEACYSLGRLVLFISQPFNDTMAVSYAFIGGRGRGSTSARRRGRRSQGGRGRLQCSFYGRQGHLEDRC